MYTILLEAAKNVGGRGTVCGIQFRPRPLDLRVDDRLHKAHARVVLVLRGGRAGPAQGPGVRGALEFHDV